MEDEGIWIFCGDVKLSGGWKIHLSSIPSEAYMLLDAVLPILKKYKYPFKVIRDEDALVSLDSGEFGVTQIGKFATIYVEDQNGIIDFLKELINHTQTFHGPDIITDLHIGSVVYIRNGAFRPVSVKYEKDRFFDYIEDSHHNIIRDTYSVPYTLDMAKNLMGEELRNYVLGLLNQSNENDNKFSAAEIKDKYHHRFNKVHYKSNTKTVYLGHRIIDPNKEISVIIKEARKFVLADSKGRDGRDMLKNDVEIFNKIRKFIGINNEAAYFEINDNGYGSFPLIEGKTLRDVIRDFDWGNSTKKEKIRIVRLFEQINQLLQKVHEKGIVHRDIKPENFIVDKADRVFVVDFDAAYDRHEKRHPFRVGTNGYVRVGATRERTSPSADTYSFGAMLFETLTSVQPEFLHSGNYDSIRLLISSRVGRRLENLINIVLETVFGTNLSESRIETEIARGLKIVVEEIATSPKAKTDTYFADDPGFRLDERRIMKLILDVYTRASDKWLMGKFPTKDITHTLSSEEIVVYNGIAGVPFVLYNSYSNAAYKSMVANTLTISEKVLKRYENRVGKPELGAGLFFGSDGLELSKIVLQNLIVSGNAGGREKSPIEEPAEPNKRNRDIGYIDIISGVVGVSLSHLLAYKLSEKKPARLGTEIIGDLHSDYSTIKNSIKHQSNENEEIFFGLAHGLAGAIYYLSEYYGIEPDANARKDCLRYVDMIYSSGSTGENACRIPVSTKNREYRNHWCHGNPGVVLALIKAYEKLHEEKLKPRLVSLLDGMRLIAFRDVNGLSLCHGFAGVGETYLRAYDVLREGKWLAKAEEILKIIVMLLGYDGKKFDITIRSIRRIYKEEDIVGLMVGFGGVVRFVSDYFLRDGVTYPFTYPL